MAENISADMDGGWKDIIGEYLEEFFEFFFPGFHEIIDFSRGWTFLDSKLNQIIADSDNIKRDADKLVEVYLKTGEVEWILIHIEVQSYRDPDFATRMYIYNYRIFDYSYRILDQDKRRKKVVSLALLIDEDKNFRPDCYEVIVANFQNTFRFPVAKLVDYDEKELENNDNPFAIATRIQLKKIEAGKDVDKRYNFKLNFTRELYRKGYSREKIIAVYKFIDFILVLPKPLAIKFKVEHEKIEEKRKMPYVTSNERLAKEEGAWESALDDVIEVIKLRFPDAPYSVIEKVKYVDDIDKLKKLHRQAVVIKFIDELDI